MIREFRVTSEDMHIFNNEFKDRLPDTLIDNHIHVWTEDCYRISKEEAVPYKGYKPWTDMDYMSEFTFEDYWTYAKETLPGKKMLGMFFGLPLQIIDTEKSNQYVLNKVKHTPQPFYYIPSFGENAFETNQKLNLLDTEGFMGFKPYPDLVPGVECSIYDSLNRSFLEFADKNHLSVVLHIPRKNRLRSKDNQREILEIAKTYPNITIILAHAGRSFCYRDIEGNLDKFLSIDNIWYDIAMLNSGMVLEYLMRHVDSNKILFGTDAPLAFYRGVDVCINNTHCYVTAVPSEWGFGTLNQNLVKFTFYLYEELRALLYASKIVYGNSEKSHLERICYLNAMRLLKDRLQKATLEELFK